MRPFYDEWIQQLRATGSSKAVSTSSYYFGLNITTKLETLFQRKKTSVQSMPQDNRLPMVQKLREEIFVSLARSFKISAFDRYSNDKINLSSANSWLQCWFKLTGQNALKLKFKTRFSQIGLSLGESLLRQSLLVIQTCLLRQIWCNFFAKFRPKILPQKWVILAFLS